MKLNILIFKVLIVVLLLCFFSCNTSIRGSKLPSEINNDIEGEYVFIYNTGEVEFLKMNLDSSYSKVVYSNDDNYQKRKDTLFFSKGKWDIEDNRIKFYDWLWCNDDSIKNKILKKPFETTVGGVGWYEPDGSEPASLLVFDEPYYEFKKVSTALHTTSDNSK